MPPPRSADRNPLVRAAHEAAFRALRGVATVLAALPLRWVLAVADRGGQVLYALDRRGRRVGRENLDVVYGDSMPWEAKRRMLKAAMREAARAIAVTLHAAPLTPVRFRRFVEVPPEVEAVLGRALKEVKGAVVVSGHLGNWEILLGFGALFPGALPLRFLAEDTFHPVMDRFLAYVRGSGGGATSRRRGGATALQHHIQRGGLAGLVIDRNARRGEGGIWAPFFGLAARTTPLPAWLARRNDVPIAPIFCLPRGDGRYRIHLLPEVSMEVRTQDMEADVLEITTRLNRLLERVILDHPEAWIWTLKRWKSRPTEDPAGYPPYSLHDA